ncbi:MAG: hypothetical protein ACE5EQ_12495, partial [Phycisphaerae bacterium]
MPHTSMKGGHIAAESGKSLGPFKPSLINQITRNLRQPIARMLIGLGQAALDMQHTAAEHRNTQTEDDPESLLGEPRHVFLRLGSDTLTKLAESEVRRQRNPKFLEVSQQPLDIPFRDECRTLNFGAGFGS